MVQELRKKKEEEANKELRLLKQKTRIPKKKPGGARKMSTMMSRK